MNATTPLNVLAADANPATSLEQRYGAGAPLLADAPNAVIESLLGHRSVRAFSNAPLPQGTLEWLVAAAQSAATSSNLQCWSVVAVQDPDRRARLSVLANNQAHVRDCPLLLVWIADLSRLDRAGETLGIATAGNRYLEMFLVAAVDAALAAQNAVAAAESLGLGTCYIGAMRNHPEQVATELGLPSDAFAIFGLCVGVPDASRPAAVKPRLAQPVVLHHEQYQVATEADAVAGYDQTMRGFQRSQGMKELDWSAQSAQRVSGPGSLSGRDRLVAALRTLGFGLE
ncbi:MAG: NADPH-dependent oxidoreductase [Quisquiliibacterium sp.]